MGFLSGKLSRKMRFFGIDEGAITCGVDERIWLCGFLQAIVLLEHAVTALQA